jgi:hypothetical protein
VRREPVIQLVLNMNDRRLLSRMGLCFEIVHSRFGGAAYQDHRPTCQIRRTKMRGLKGYSHLSAPHS